MQPRKVVVPAPVKPASPPQRDLVIVENSVLAALARSPDAVKEFPFLETITKAASKESCRACERNTGVEKAFAKAKKMVAGLASGQHQKLLKLLNAKRARVNYKTGEGTSRDVHF